MKICTILGTRPEIIKLSALLPMLDKASTHTIIHSGQHYDFSMDKIFFEELGLRSPDIELKVGSGTHAEMTARIILGVERSLINKRPDAVIVQGDTNTTLAGALAASKLGIPIIHVEAGCRSFNSRMPEETNRIIADRLSKLLFAMDHVSVTNLDNEGIRRNVFNVGNTGIDAFFRSKKRANKSNVLARFKLKKGKYALATIHREESADTKATLLGILQGLGDIAKTMPVIIPIHPRLLSASRKFNISLPENVHGISPVGFLDFIALEINARLILTDSGGVQQEAALANVPCIVLRDETEYVELVKKHKLVLAGRTRSAIVRKAKPLLVDSSAYLKMRRSYAGLRIGASAKIMKKINSIFG